MENTELILVRDFCVHHSITITFITDLSDAGLITLIEQEQEHYIHNEEVAQVEKLVRLYIDLDINIEGIEAIAHLLRQVEDLQGQVNRLTQKLSIYE